MNRISEEELQSVQSLREELVEIVTKIGELRINKFIASQQVDEIEQAMQQTEDEFVAFREKERVLFEELQQKYGPHIDFETGEVKE